MTQKELLYYEDAIGHEENVIKILNTNCQNIEDSELSEFLEEEISIHTSIKESLLILLEEKVNE